LCSDKKRGSAPAGPLFRFTFRFEALYRVGSQINDPICNFPLQTYGLYGLFTGHWNFAAAPSTTTKAIYLAKN